MAAAPFQDAVINGIGLVVDDVPTTARTYARLFRVTPWQFFDVDVDSAEGPESLRVGRGRLGRLTLDLVAPLTAEGPHRRFLENHGPGVHHLCLNVPDDIDAAARHSGLPALSGAPFGAHAYLDAQPSLATRLLLNPAEKANPWGHFDEDEPVVDMAGREIVQVGIVVDDVAETAAEYTRLLGVSDWRFLDFKAPAEWHGIFKDIPAAGAGFHIKAAIGWHGDMQLELLQPVCGSSTHMDYLRASGPGIHHLSFDAIDDHDEVCTALLAAGVRTEMAGELGPDLWFTYLDTRQPLGTIYEMIRRG